MSNVEDTGRRRFLTTTTAVVGATAAGVAAVPFISAWLPSAKAKALGAPVTIDISKLEPGMIVKELWRGKPVWVVRRTVSSVKALADISDRLRDPESLQDMQPNYAKNLSRSIKSEIAVLLGVCTHLGCAPTYITAAGPHDLGDDWTGGFFCPCHGSKFDLAGRVYKGVPAPTNLEVPPHRYASDSIIVIGEDAEGSA